MDPARDLPGVQRASDFLDPHEKDILSKAFKDPRLGLSEAGNEDYDTPSLYPSFPADGLIIPGSAPVQMSSVHSREKLSHPDAMSQLTNSLIKHGMSVEDSLAESILRHTKCASLTPVEYELVALLVRACQDNFALNSMKMAIEDITSRLKTLTSELDDASKKAKSVTYGLQTNVQLTNDLISAASKREVIPAIRTEIPPAITAKDKAIRMLDGAFDPNHPQYNLLLESLTWYLTTHAPQLSIETFKSYRQSDSRAILDRAYELYSRR